LKCRRIFAAISVGAARVWLQNGIDLMNDTSGKQKVTPADLCDAIDCWMAHRRTADTLKA